MSHPSSLEVDRLGGGEVVEVLFVEDAGYGGGDMREPHRHDYHELIWVRSGSGHHLIDGEPLHVREGSITVIGRGQVHVFARAEHLNGAVVRFGDELLRGGAAERATPGWLLTGRGGRTVPVPPAEVANLEAVIAALASETERRRDPCSPDLERHLLSVILLWIERWYDTARAERPDADDAEVVLHRRFSRVLEDEFATHHDAAHYADALAVPAAALSKALSQVTGRSTKELITDRVMVEAARLLRFTSLTVGEVAHRVGFADQLYFSRAFKRYSGEAPKAYRQRARPQGAMPVTARR